MGRTDGLRFLMGQPMGMPTFFEVAQLDRLAVCADLVDLRGLVVDFSLEVFAIAEPFCHAASMSCTTALQVRKILKYRDASVMPSVPTTSHPSPRPPLLSIESSTPTAGWPTAEHRV